MDDLISRQSSIDALWKALYEYEDKTEKQFIESEELDVGDWILHRIFVQNMSDIDRQVILNMPSAQRKGKWIRNNDSDHAWKCSECGCGYTDYRLNYCYDCGAKMEGGKDETN